MDLMAGGVRDSTGERDVWGMVDCLSSEGRGPQVTLRVLYCMGVEVVKSEVRSSVSVGCCAVFSRSLLVGGGGRIGPLRVA